MCLHALSSFQRTDCRPAAPWARRAGFPPLHVCRLAASRPRLGEPSKVTSHFHVCQPKICGFSTAVTVGLAGGEGRSRLLRGTKKSAEKPQQISAAHAAGHFASNVRTVSRTCRTPSSQPHQMILLLPLPQHEHAAANRLLARQPRLRIRHAAVVHVDAARLHQPPRFALRRRQPARAPADPRSPMPSASNSCAGSSVDGTSSNTASTSSAGSVAMSSPNSSSTRARRARPALRRARASSPRARARAAPRASRARLHRSPRVRRSRRWSRNVKNFRYGTTSRSSVFSQN